jgi:hypothetical protein
MKKRNDRKVLDAKKKQRLREEGRYMVALGRTLVLLDGAVA